MTEVTNRNEVRAGIAAGGWVIAWGDLINEIDVIEGAISLPTGSVGGWVSMQLNDQLRKFSQSLADVAPEVMQQAIDHLKQVMKGKGGGERDFNGLGVKGGIATYNRKMVFKIRGKVVGQTKLPNNHQPYIGLRVTKPMSRVASVVSMSPAALQSEIAIDHTAATSDFFLEDNNNATGNEVDNDDGHGGFQKIEGSRMSSKL